MEFITLYRQSWFNSIQKEVNDATSYIIREHVSNVMEDNEYEEILYSIKDEIYINILNGTD